MYLTGSFVQHFTIVRSEVGASDLIVRIGACGHGWDGGVVIDIMVSLVSGAVSGAKVSFGMTVWLVSVSR